MFVRLTAKRIYLVVEAQHPGQKKQSRCWPCPQINLLIRFCGCA